MTKTSALTSLTKSGRRALGYLKRRAFSFYHLKRDVEIIERSGLFDRDWYLKQYPDVAETKMDPIKHYLRYGAPEGRDPNPEFSTWGYVETYPDVGTQRMNPFIHYLLYGLAEGRVLVKKDYAAWIDDYDRLSDEDRVVFRRAIERMAKPPLISVLMPVYNTRREHLERAIGSVIDQLYPNWELCISDDASTQPEVREVLEAFATKDTRIKVTYREANGHIAANSNSALAHARGDYVAMLDHDDVLAEQALFWFAHEVLKHPDAQIVYCDEDKLNEQGRRYGPLFKPDWNPAMIMGQNYVCHMTMYRRALIERVGGFRAGFDGSQDLDLLLRCADLVPAEGIRHIPRVLYHWRADSGSTASEIGLEAKPYAWDAGARAIQEHLDRRKIKASVKPVIDQYYQAEYAQVRPAPKVVVIIPTALKEFVPRCISSVLQDTTYPNVEFIVAVNQAHVQTSAQRGFLEKIKGDPRVRVQLYEAPTFNYARVNNRAAELSDAPVVCFLNDDVEVITSDWLEKLVARVMLDGVGAAGPILYYPNDRIQHAGVILGIGGVAGHQFHNMPRGNAGYYGRALLEQDLSCITAACMVMRREVFDSVGGFNEKFAVAFNDVDLCIRVRRLGWRILLTPTVEMYHHESASLGKHNAPQRQALFEEEVQLMRATWGDLLDADPFFNPNLSLATPYYTLAFPPRIAKLPPREDVRPARNLAEPRRASPPPDARTSGRARTSFADMWETAAGREPGLSPTVIIAGLETDRASALTAQLAGAAASRKISIVAVAPHDSAREGVTAAPCPEGRDICLHLEDLIRAASGEFAVLLSASGRLGRGWLGALYDAFERFETAGAVCGTVMTENGRIAWSAAAVDADGRVHMKDRGADPAEPHLASVRSADLLWPGLVAIRRDAFMRAGGFGAGHASLAAGLVDLSVRLKENGELVLVQPFARLHVSSSAGDDGGPRLSRQTTGRVLASSIVRPRALFIDRYTPTPDSDSGSNDIYWFMRIMLDLGYEVTFVPARAPEHAGRYTDELRLLGVICPVAPALTSARAFLEAHGREFDAIFLYRVTVANELIDIARRAAPQAKIVFDTVDLHFLREQRAAELIASPKALAEAEEIKEVELRVIRETDATILVSRYEYDLIGKLAPDASRFHIPIVRPVPGRLAPFDERRGALFVGGFHHAPNVDAVHFLCGSIWPIVRSLLPGAKLFIVGADAPDEILAYHAPSEGVEILGYIEDLAELYRTVRLTVAPLRFGAGLKGKVVASLVVGLPCVATSEAAEGMINPEEAGILVADDPNAFAQAVAKIHEDRALWYRISDAGVAYAQRHFSIEVTSHRLREMLKHLDLPCA